MEHPFGLLQLVLNVPEAPLGAQMPRISQYENIIRVRCPGAQMKTSSVIFISPRITTGSVAAAQHTLMIVCDCPMNRKTNKGFQEFPENHD